MPWPGPAPIWTFSWLLAHRCSLPSPLLVDVAAADVASLVAVSVEEGAGAAVTVVVVVDGTDETVAVETAASCVPLWWEHAVSSAAPQSVRTAALRCVRTR
jgi:hypothetical protein